MVRRENREKRSVWGWVLRTLTGTAIVVGGVWLSYYWLTHKPKAHKRFRGARPKAPLVETIRPKPVNLPATVETFGTVVPVRTQTLASRVTSQITYLSPALIPGGIVRKGDLLVKLDESDFQLALRERAASVASARLALETELENQKSAAFELSLSEQNVSKRERAFILRHPHVAAAKAALKAAEAAYEKARLDLRRCRIYAPFDAVITGVTAAVGDVAGASKSLATLVRADRFWLRAVVSVRTLAGVEIPGYNASKGSFARLYRQDARGGAPVVAEGVVEGVEKAVDTKSKMAYLLIGIKDPLGLKQKRDTAGGLLLGEYLYAKIRGKTLKGVLKIPSGALRSNDTLWILRPDHRLHIQNVPIRWREEGWVYVDADILAPGEAIVTTVIETPVEGMRLRTVLEASQKAQRPSRDNHAAFRGRRAGR
ncbi:MAG: efflux RND transporter periplasmic adaptor subunit [Epsilonproteobacteria bacterium]|nr:efflux RND transporter periplasmic adaptor subunit [Campylobacterota bacterium]